MALLSDMHLNILATPLLDPAKLPLFILTILAILITLLAAWLVRRKNQGNPTRVRTIPGLASLDDAVGRATEMGRPTLFTTGWGGDIQRPTTIAALSIFGEVAERASRYHTRLLFPTHDPVIMAVAEEIARERAARVDGLPPGQGDISYVSSSQFGYAAAVDGILVRERPSAVFLVGTFEAESLILAETGNSIGAIQIAGTDSTIQLAFFVVACDYTLIGEEVFAASGYLTQEPDIVGTILAQDWMKILIAFMLIIATLSATFWPQIVWWK